LLSTNIKPLYLLKFIIILMKYEITYILKPELTTEEQDSKNLLVKSHIESLKGKIFSTERTFSVERGGTDENNLRMFAFPIKHYRQGYYYTSIFELEGSKLKELDTILSREESILRFLVIKDFVELKPVEKVTPVAQDSEEEVVEENSNL